MPLPTPFHSRTAPLCKTAEWRNWAGYQSVISYEHSHEFEYYAIRNAAGLIDVSPLFKYEISGPDAARLLDRVITRNIGRCKVGQVVYTSWCDEDGKMIDDGTIQRLAENHFRVTAASPSLRWFEDCAWGMNVSIRDISGELAALALQGPNSRAILKALFRSAAIDSLKFFYLLEAAFNGIPIIISRTGYTGDLGYELWVPREAAEMLWDALMEAGRGYGITPSGLAALDISRVEAGLLLIDVDYISSKKALIPARKSSPYEAGLGWTVHLKKPAFVGREALAAEKARGPAWRLVGLEVDWADLERYFAEVNLPPQVTGRASRLAVPVYKNQRQIGQATSSAFSPVLKKLIALATLESAYTTPGTEVEMEITVEFSRRKARATVVNTPFFNPKRKRT